MSEALDFTLNPSEYETFFHDSLLGLYLGSAAISVFEQGKVQVVSVDQAYQAQGPEHLTVLLRGVLVHHKGWISPGCHFAGDDLALMPKDAPAAVWSIDLSESGPLQSRCALRAAITAALAAAQRAVDAATPPRDLPAPDSLCDVDHPMIRRQATRLLRATEAATAEAIFKFVQAMPYRFGTWQERASETLARGSGMCTTKANLQVALMRVAGLEAGFVEVPMSMKVLGELMPEAWLMMMRPTVRHYYGAVKLGGRWHAADSSYNDDSATIYLKTLPQLAWMLPVFLGEGRPYSPTAEAQSLDPFDITVVPHLNEEMGKKSRFTPAQFEALNTRLDRAQHCWQKWVDPDHPDLQPAEQASTERLA